MRLYVSSSDFGNSRSVRRRFAGKQCRRTSNWQKTHRNLIESMTQRYDHDESKMSLHSIRFSCQCLNDHSPVIVSPSLHPFVRANDTSEVIDDVLLLPDFVMEGYLLSYQKRKRGANVELGPTRHT